MPRPLTVVQMLPALDSGGVERGTLEVAGELVRRGHRAVVISAGGRMTEELKALGAEHLEWPVGEKRLATLLWIRRVRAYLAVTRPEILHLRSRLPAWIGWLAWRGLPVATRPHLVTTVHGFYTPGFYSSVMVRGEGVIAVSESVRGYIRTHYPAVPEGRIRVVHRGVDTALYRPDYRPAPAWLAAWQAQYPELNGRYLVTLPARITRWKGHEAFVEIIGALKARGLPVHGLMVGGPHPRKQAFLHEIEALIRARGLAADITITGHRSDLMEVLSVSDAVLSLSTDPEAFGRTTIEALSLGRPVAGYAHGGVGEQLAELFPAGAVEVGDVAGMTARLASWYDQRPLVGENRVFTLRRMLDSTLDLYTELAKGPR